jgi:hypothetical protein
VSRAFVSRRFVSRPFVPAVPAFVPEYHDLK